MLSGISEASVCSMRDKLQHYLNPLHIYCLLRSVGFPRAWAIYLAHRWTTIYRLVGL